MGISVLNNCLVWDKFVRLTLTYVSHSRQLFNIHLSHARRMQNTSLIQSWNKYVSTWPQVYYALLHSHNTLTTVLKRIHNLTIIEMPPSAWTADRNPSDMFIVTDWPTSVVSVDRRFINSPVLFLSKNAISCRTIDEKSLARRLRTIRLPWQPANIQKLQTQKRRHSNIVHSII